MLIWTTGDLDTVGELQNSSGTVLDSNDDGPFSNSLLNFFMWRTLAAGTYRLKVSSYGDATGPTSAHQDDNRHQQHCRRAGGHLRH